MSKVSALEITTLQSLTLEEEAERLRLERKVEKAFYQAGLALKTLRDQKLYRSTHSNFRDYCQERFGLKKSAVYYLIASVDIVDNLQKCPPLVEILPTSERQCRPLKALNPEHQKLAWTKAVEKAGGIPTAKIVKDVVSEIKKDKIQPKTVAEITSYIQYVPLTRVRLGQKVRVKANHGLFPLEKGQIVQIPNKRSAIIMLEDNTRELIDIKDLEMQRIVDSNGNVTTPREGCNRIAGAGLDWYIRVDEETFKKLDSFAAFHGIPTLGLAVKRLLEGIEN